MPDVSLATFPSSESEALAYLYVQQHITAEMTVEDIAKLYYSVRKDFRNSLKDLRYSDPDRRAR